MPKHKTTTKVIKKYPHELNQRQWKQLRGLLPQPKKKTHGPGRPALDLREVINAILYVMRSGCSWSMLPNDYPKYKSVFHYYNTWSKAGTWEKMHIQLVKKVRKKAGRKKRPTTACLDSQSVKATQIGGEARGFDGAKVINGAKVIKGRKRFLLVDPLGLLLAVNVVAASVAEKVGAQRLLTRIWATDRLKHLCGRIELVWVDAGYQGDDLYDWVAKLTRWLWQVVKRTDGQKGFVVLPRRWVVERSFAWVSFNRRSSKDYEKLTRNSEAAIYASMLPMMLRRLS